MVDARVWREDALPDHVYDYSCSDSGGGRWDSFGRCRAGGRLRSVGIYCARISKYPADDCLVRRGLIEWRFGLNQRATGDLVGVLRP